MCEHVYKFMGSGPCGKCGLPTHDLNWNKENILLNQWRINNPDAEYVGWTSI